MKSALAKNIFLFLFLGASLALAVSANAAFQGPPAGANPSTGGGLMGVDPNRNIELLDIQTGDANATPAGMLDGAAFGRVFMITADNNPGIGLKNLSSGKEYVLAARNNGTLAMWDGAAEAVRFYIDTSGNIVVGSTDPALDKLHVFGNIRAENSFIGGRMQAAYLASDVFGLSAGRGNFAFPAALGVGVESTGGLPPSGLYVAGNVGIGTTATGPARKLHVNETGVFSARFETNSTDASVVEFKNTSNDVVWEYGVSGSIGAFSRSVASGAMYLYRQGLSSPPFVILSGGNVGIGTFDPKRRLHVANEVSGAGFGATFSQPLVVDSSGHTGLAIQSAGGYLGGITFSDAWTTDQGVIRYDHNADAMEFYTLGTEKVRISSNGNVGIGTPNPGAKLDVQGRIDAGTGSIRFMGQTTWEGSTDSLGRAQINVAPDGAFDTLMIVGKAGGHGSALDSGGIGTRTVDIWDALYVNGNEYITGNVGIGTTDLSKKLNIVGDVKVEGDVIANNVGASAVISAANVAGGATFGSLSNKGYYRFEAALNTNPVLFIDATNEKVGIGTAAPGAKLEIWGNSPTMKLTQNPGLPGDSTFTISAAGTNNNATIQIAGAILRGNTAIGSDLLINPTSGNVGIGTASPGAKLHVADSSSAPHIGLGVNAGAGGYTYLDIGLSSVSGGYSYLQSVQSAGSAWGNLLLNPSGGNVGVGTTEPKHALDIQGAYYSRMVQKGDQLGPTVNINWNEGNIQHIILKGNITTMNFTGGQSGGRYVLVIKQTGSYTISSWPNTRFPGGSTFNVSTGASPTAPKTDYFGFLYNGVDSKYDSVAFSAAFF
ncbi:MAG: hypothetical protein Q8P01_05105 [bacterium]|nr:hypothetical protein [bacterium]